MPINQRFQVFPRSTKGQVVTEMMKTDSELMVAESKLNVLQEAMNQEEGPVQTAGRDPKLALRKSSRKIPKSWLWLHRSVKLAITWSMSRALPGKSTILLAWLPRNNWTSCMRTTPISGKRSTAS